MTQNEVSIIKNSVLDATEAYVDARLAVADFVKTQIGVVVSATQNTTTKKWYHTVRCNATASNPNGITYSNVLSVNNIHFTNNSVVFIIAPNAQFSNQFILGKLDNVPYDITAGSIDIGNGVFTVSSEGVVSIKSGSINLTYNDDVKDYNFKVNSTGIYLGVTGTSSTDKDYNFIVNSNGVVSIKRGTINLTYNSTLEDYNFKVNSTGIHLGITGTSSTDKDYNFIVNSTGTVTIRQGNIRLGATTVGTVSGYNVNLASNGLRLGLSGGTTANPIYNFSVTSDGVVTIKNGSILLGEKTVSGNKGYDVNLNSTGLGLGYLGNNSSNVPQYNFTVSSGGVVNIKKGSITIGNNNEFEVTSGGVVTCKNFTANINGEIAGWTINSDGLKYGSYAMVTTEIIACGSHGGTHVKMRGHNDSGDDSGYLSVEVNEQRDAVRVYTNDVIKYDAGGHGTHVMWDTPSDIRLKKNIKQLSFESAKNFIDNLIPKQYEFKSEKGKRYGFIAQDVEKITNKDFNIIHKEDDYLFLHYYDIIAPLVKVVQNQQQEINILKKHLEV